MKPNEPAMQNDPRVKAMAIELSVEFYSSEADRAVLRASGSLLEMAGRLLAAADAATPSSWSPIEEGDQTGTPCLVRWRGDIYHPMASHCEDGEWGYLTEHWGFVAFATQPDYFMPFDALPPLPEQEVE